MQNTVDTRSQQIQQQRFDNKAKKNSADTTESKVKTPVLNRPATTQYLNIVSHEQEELGDVLSRSYNRLNQALTQTASAPDNQTIDEQAEKMGTYTKLAVKVINRDPHLQEQVAQDLSTGKKLVRSRNAADTLQESLSNLPRPLKEGTNTGKQLAKFIVENLVSLTDTKNMGAGLERDLAVRQISVPKKPLTMRSQQAASKVLSASIAYVQSNQPEVLSSLESDEPEVVKPGTTTAQVMTRYLRQALNEFPDDSTYLDIFKQNRSHQKSEGYADKMSEEIAQRIHNLISKAANTAKSGNLIQLSPEEAARFDQIQREAAGQGLNQNRSSMESTNAQNTQGTLATTSNAAGQKNTATGQNIASADKALASNASNVSEPEPTNVRDLSLSELSARAAKLQQQFRQERQRLANDGKLPDPAPMPTKSFDNVKTALDILKGTLSPENFALTERQQQVKEQATRQQNTLSSALVASKFNAETTAQEQSSNAASKLVQTLSSTVEQKAQSSSVTQSNAHQNTQESTPSSSNPNPKGNEANALTQTSANSKSSESASSADTSQSTSTSQNTSISQSTSASQTALQEQSVSSAKEGEAAQNVATQKNADTLLTSQLKQLQNEQNVTSKTATNSQDADISLAQGTLQAQRASFQMEFSAIQNTLYGDLDIMPGMTIPVSHFGELSQDTLQPNQQALESLKYQARILEESLKQQDNAQNTNQKNASTPAPLASALTGDNELSELEKAVSSTKPDSQAVSTKSPNQLQQFLQQAASLLQQHAKSTGEPLNMEQSQLQQFLQQAQSILQKLDPNLGQNAVLNQTTSSTSDTLASSEQKTLTSSVPNTLASSEQDGLDKTAQQESLAKPNNTQAKASEVQNKAGESSNKDSDVQTKASDVLNQSKDAQTKSDATTPKSGDVPAQSSDVSGNSKAKLATNEFILPSKEQLQNLISKTQKSLDAQVKAQDGLIFPTQNRLKEQLDSLQSSLNKGGVTSENLTKLQQALSEQIKSQGEQITPVQLQLQKALTQAQNEIEDLEKQQAEALAKANQAAKLLAGLSQDTITNLQDVLSQSQNKLEQLAASQDGMLFTTQNHLKEQMSALQNILSIEKAQPTADRSTLSVSEPLKNLQQALSEQIKSQGNQSTPLQTKLMQLVNQAQDELQNTSASAAKTDSQSPTDNQRSTDSLSSKAILLQQTSTTTAKQPLLDAKDAEAKTTDAKVADAKATDVKTATAQQTTLDSKVDAAKAALPATQLASETGKNADKSVLPLETLNNLKEALSKVQDNLAKLASSQDGQLFPSQSRLLEQLSSVQKTLTQLESQSLSPSEQKTLTENKGVLSGVLNNLQQALSEQIKSQGNQSLPVQSQLQQVLEQSLSQLNSAVDKNTAATNTDANVSATQPNNAKLNANLNAKSLAAAPSPISQTALDQTALDTERLTSALEQAQKNILQQIKSQGDKAVAEQLNLIKSIESAKAGIEQKLEPARLVALLNNTQNDLSALTKLQGNLQTPAQAQLQQVLAQSLAAIREEAAQNQAAITNTTDSKQGAAQTVDPKLSTTQTIAQKQPSTLAAEPKQPSTPTAAQNPPAAQGATSTLGNNAVTPTAENAPAQNISAVSQGVLSMLQSFNDDIVQTQNALKVLQEAPALQQKQAAFDSIQKLLTSAHNKITSPTLEALPNLPQLQQLVGFSELSVINIARANTPERTMQAIQQLNLCLTQAQREVKGTLDLVSQIQNQNNSAQATGQTVSQNQTIGQTTAQHQNIPAQTVNQTAGQTVGQNPNPVPSANASGSTVPTPSHVENQPKNLTSNNAHNASNATSVTNAVPSTEDSITTEEAELAAKFNQLRPAFGDGQSPQQTANGHIQGAANLGTALHSNYANAPQNSYNSILQSQSLTERLSAQGMDWMANSAQVAGMSTEQYAKALAQAQAIAEQYRPHSAQLGQATNSRPSIQNSSSELTNSNISNLRYVEIFSRLYGHPENSVHPQSSAEQGLRNAPANASGNAALNTSGNAPALNQSIIALGAEETETPEGVSKENSIFSTRTSLSAGKERLEAQQERREATNSAQQIQAQHAAVKEIKETSLEQHQARQENLNQQQQAALQQQQRADTAIKQEQAKQDIEQAIRQQQAVSAQGKLNIASDPELVDQQFARLYQQQRADQLQQQQSQAAQIAHQLKAGGTSITASHAQVLAQSAVLGDSVQHNQALGVHGTDGASRAAAEAQAQALAQGTNTIGRTAVVADDALATQHGRPQATVGNTAVEARNPITAGQNALQQASANQSAGFNQATGQTQTVTAQQQGVGSLQQGLTQGSAQPNQAALQSNQGAAYQTQGAQLPQNGAANTQNNLSNLANAAATKTSGISAVQGTNALAGVSGPSGAASTTGTNQPTGLVPTGDGRNALSVASLNKSMPFGATIPNSSTQLTIHLDDINLDDPIVKNMGSTVPAQEGSLNAEEGALNTNALSGVVADTEFAKNLNEAAQNAGIAGDSLSRTGMAGSGVAGAAAITSGENAPIPNESVVPNVATLREGGLLQRIASLFAGKTHDDLGEEVEANKTAKDLAASPEMLRSLQEQAMQSQLKQSTLDNLMQRLQSSVVDQNLPPQIREQANKLMKALENPVADLHSVSSWLNFVTGPMSPSSSQALAMHQWAFMLLCIRFEQIGKNVEKFLKKRMSGEDLLDLEPSLTKAHTDSGIFNDLVDEPQEKAQELLEDALSQVSRMQQQMAMLPAGQLLPRNIPLPPFYRGGKEGSLHAQQQTDEDGGKSWHLNFNLDLEKLGPMQVKVKLRFPDIQMSFVTGNLEALQAVQAHMPELNARLKEIGLTSKGSSARLGRLPPPAPTNNAAQSHTRNTYADNEFSTKA